MASDWILRVGDGENFKNSSKFKIWGISSTNSMGKYFLKNVKPGDKLWFMTSKSKGKIIAVATYLEYKKREIGPLVYLSMSDKELGWTGGGKEWKADIEIYYSDLYVVENCEIFVDLKGPSTIRLCNEKCGKNLPKEYSSILKYSKIQFSF